MILLIIAALVLFAICFLVFAVLYSRRRSGQLGKVEVEPAQAPRRLEALRLPYRYADDVVYVYDTTVWTGFRLATVTDESHRGSGRRPGRGSVAADSAARIVAATHDRMSLYVDPPAG